MTLKDMTVDTEFEGVWLECCDCGVTFPWTAGEQRYFAQNGFAKPRRCKPCRLAKRQRMEERAGFATRHEPR